MYLSLCLSLLVLPYLITSNPINPAPPSQEFLAPVEDAPLFTANKWELKPFPDPICSGVNTKTHNGTSTNACTVLANTPSKGFRFFSTLSSFKVCFYNKNGCAKDDFCGKNDGESKCRAIGGKGPAVAFKIVNKGEKCIEGGPVLG